MSDRPQHPLDDWAQELGKLLNSFQSLEFALRAFLYEREAAPGGRFPYAHDLYSDPVGTVVPLNAVTDYRTLGQLIQAYNGLVAGPRPQAAIDPAVVDVRDALAHGRVSTSEPGEALDLVKYDRPAKTEPGVVRVAMRIRVTRAWMREKLEIVQDSTMRVVQAHEELPKSETV